MDGPLRKEEKKFTVFLLECHSLKMQRKKILCEKHIQMSIVALLVKSIVCGLNCSKIVSKVLLQ